MSNFVFISYSKRDLEIALRMNEHLNDQHVNTWLFEVQHSSGCWWDEIVSAIHHSAAVLLILSPESQTSRWVRREIDLGRYWQKPVFGMLTDGDLHLSADNFITIAKLEGHLPAPDFIEHIKRIAPPQDTAGRNVMGTPFEPHSIENDVTVDYDSLLTYRKIRSYPAQSALQNDLPTDSNEFDFKWCSVPEGKVIVHHHFRAYPHTVPPFEIARYPVTCAQFKHFVNSSDGYHEQCYWTELGWRWKGEYAQPFLWDNSHWNRPEHPVVGVSWHEAVAFCAWLDCHFGQAENVTYCLQSEVQFLRAVQGTTSAANSSYPWGETITCEQANVLGCGPFHTTPVNQYDAYASEYGVCDLIGNVWEWCVDNWDRPLDIDTAGDFLRVVRGGSWNDHAEMGRCRSRFRDEPDYRGSDLGFRIVRVPRNRKVI